MRRFILTLMLLAGLTARNGYPQEGDGQLRFEVASLKPTPESQSQVQQFCKDGPGTPNPGRLECSNFPLRALLFFAYGVQRYQVIGPGWIDSAFYDVVAKVPAGVTRDQMKLMLRSLLEERLGVRVHRETRRLPAYSLIVGKNGPKMTPQADAPARPGFPPMGPGTSFGLKGDGRFHITGDRLPMSEFTRILTSLLQQPVIDETGLKGAFGFQMDFEPEDPVAPRADAATIAAGPDLFAAFEERLGLKLVAGKHPLEVVVVDHAERTPIGN